MTPAPAPHKTLFGLRPKVLLKGLAMLLAFAALGWGLRAVGLDSMMDEAWIDAKVKGQGLYGIGLFLLISAGFTAAGLPRQAVCLLGGYAFGFVEGMLFSLLGSMLGCVLAFYYARLFGRSFVRARFSERIKRIDAFLHDNTLSMTLLARLLPVGSNLLTNLAAGVSGVRALPFFAGSALGYLPQTIIFALAGDGINDARDYLLLVSGGLFVLSAFLGVYLYRRFRHGKSLSGAIDAETAEEMEDEVPAPLAAERAPD